MSSKYLLRGLWRRSRSHLRRVSLRRNYREEEYEGYDFHYAWKLRGNRDEAFAMVADWDWPYVRARHTTGWKSGKCRRQWEHNVVEREKHERNRRARVCRNGGELFPRE